MADVISPKKEQAKAEIRAWDIDFTDDLKTAVTVSSATATHTPPSGTAATPTVAVSSPVVTVTLGPLSVTGTHYLDIDSTLSDGEISSVRLVIIVNF
jgi:hypothetical protein